MIIHPKIALFAGSLCPVSIHRRIQSAKRTSVEGPGDASLEGSADHSGRDAFSRKKCIL